MMRHLNTRCYLKKLWSLRPIREQHHKVIIYQCKTEQYFIFGGDIINYYKNFTNDLNYIYSLDMVRYNFELIENGVEKFSKFINNYNMIYGCNVKFFPSKSGIGYKYLYNVTIEDNNNKCSFAIGFGLNSKSQNMNSGFIEFNPNKCFVIAQFEKFFFEFSELCCSFKLVRYDCAIDIPVSRNKVKLLRNYRCNYEYLIESSKARSSFE